MSHSTLSAADAEALGQPVRRFSGTNGRRRTLRSLFAVRSARVYAVTVEVVRLRSSGVPEQLDRRDE